MYSKLFAKILDSSIWLEAMPTRIVWLTLLATMDQDGFAQFAALGNLANRARVSLADAQKAVKTLEEPDPESADPEHEGRRIERVPGGWMVLNAVKYRELVTADIKRAQTRDRVRKHRERKRNLQVTLANAEVTPSEALALSEAHSEDQDPPADGRDLAERKAAFVHDWAVVLEFYGHQCAYCEQAAATEMDHVVPTSKGGSHEIANVVPACKPCNSAKRASIWAPRRRHPFMPSPVKLSIESVRSHLKAAAHQILDEHPNIHATDLSEELKCIAVKLRAEYDGSGIHAIIEAVRAERERRRA